MSSMQVHWETFLVYPVIIRAERILQKLMKGSGREKKEVKS